MDEIKYLTAAEYAIKVGRDRSTILYKIRSGNIPGAVKRYGLWLIPEDAPYDDMRMTSGKYVNWRKPKTEE